MSVFESNEATAARARTSTLPVVRLVLLAIFAWRAGAMWWPIYDAIDRVVTSHYPTASINTIEAGLSLAFRLAALLLAGSALARVAEMVRTRPRLPREATPARVDGEGLHLGPTLVVPRAKVASAQVSTDQDLGYALVLTTREGTTVSVPQRSEATARGLAAALAPGVGVSDLVFEGVAGSRSRQTFRAVLAVTAVLLTGVAVKLIAWLVNDPTTWAWFEGWRAAIPYTAAWWLEIAYAFGLLPVGVALTAALGPTMRRLRAGRVVVGPQGVTTTDGAWAALEIAKADPGAESEVTITLRHGKSVRLSFDPERAVVERDLFVTRVRELASTPSERTYSAAEASGVRVALQPIEPDAHDEPEEATTAEPRQRRHQ